MFACSITLHLSLASSDVWNDPTRAVSGPGRANAGPESAARRELPSPRLSGSLAPLPPDCPRQPETAEANYQPSTIYPR
jgi:hypothetical protein